MKVFISSVVRGLEDERSVAVDAAASMGNDVRRAEDFGASMQSPQQACLAGVRWSEAVVLLLGSRYGERQASGLSATHEEYREARDARPVLAFVQSGVEREVAQASFVEEVQDWQGGVLTGSFASAEELSGGVVRALHELALSRVVGPVDDEEMHNRAIAAAQFGQTHGFRTAAISLVTAFGPHQQILRPSSLENDELSRDLHEASLLGRHAIFDTREGVEKRFEGSRLILEQPSASLSLDEDGSINLQFPAVSSEQSGLPAILEEDVHDRLTRALRLTAAVVDRIDPVTRLIRALPIVVVSHASGYGWRTREEQNRQPNSMSMPMHADDIVSVELTPATRPRAALVHEAGELAQDFVVLLRRRFK